MSMPLHVSRRFFVGLAAAVATGSALAQSNAASYPNQPIRLVVPYPAGGGTDVLARSIAIKLRDAWGQPVVVDNRPGASGVLGNEFVAKAAPDGHTVLMTISGMLILAALKKLPYDVVRDFRPLAQVGTTNSVFLVPPSVPASTLKEFVALARANPGKYSYGSFGVGTSAHLNGEALKLRENIDLVHVPYKGSAPLLTDLRGGQLTAGIVDMATAKSQLEHFKALAVTGGRRNPALPNVPTFAELGYEWLKQEGWFGLFMPAGVPEPIATKFASEVQRILKAPDMVARIQAQGLTPSQMNADEFARSIRADLQVYKRVVQEAHIHAE